MHLKGYVHENVCFIHDKWQVKHAAWAARIVKEY
jgi:hypothetical protein